ncbi:21672_t:CDS:2 [Gigaspora margarita]|uniref:21672_t:CDS:1 n=1 Tax=Gigaspora margarita TaxID=4874 RepID=A0ABN7VUS4_GIGMA|nr:21672_t:CDS:2 [Gigaspora margarita]
MLSTEMKELPVPGAIRTTLKEPDNVGSPSYCTEKIPCVYWNANQRKFRSLNDINSLVNLIQYYSVQYPSDGAGFAFFTTRLSITHYPTLSGCSFLNATSLSDNCFFKSNATTILPKSYIAGIENYTVMVEHSIRGSATSIALRSGVMDGELMSFDGKSLRTITNATRMASNPNADGDIFTVQELLTAAGANLDSPSTAPGADKSANESYRSSGIVIIIVIEYRNVPYKTDVISYKYLPRIIDGNEYKVFESVYNVADGSYTILDRHGIRFIFQQHGSIGEFDLITLLTSIVASFALFGGAKIIVETIMLNLSTNRKDYKDAKYKHLDRDLEK